ncbi:hypothetical protein B0H65DRAFT_476283 [Neurospora tetraspora]|uniref:Ecp2 effector protein domain-containing protein n=1 Tax=Neurospora tetraspora TaxID=94610 RepID=A0AAE0MNN8_9PEZI|nr:hypothetical protein B0H65DRAFT_476283 [Neurospora tetraspora]
MRTTMIAATLATLAGFTMAAPAPEAQIANRQWTPHVYVCITTGWNRCSVLDANRGQCYDLTKMDDLGSSLTGFGPDPGLTCSLFSNQDCTGDHLDYISYPGIGDLHDKGWNDKAKSYKCV